MTNDEGREMAVVIRCPKCRAAARVGPEVVGRLVACPGCAVEFVAVVEVAVVARPAAPRPEDRDPAERSLRGKVGARRPLPVAVPVDPDDGTAVVAELYPEQPGGLPLSVMIGLALLPFMIPLVWLLAPAVVGWPPALTAAAPVALAVAASALC